ncbi:glycine-rich domain-containing protein [Helicobacter cynogastricus]|uniref:glycine-rich domain-containing protein n=1 Tax=Helicobacter cynogastricus TaxID=329937 RepID=UPI000CF15B92|nr:hypothetical protein [Helicobacter cynogastricus]
MSLAVNKLDLEPIIVKIMDKEEGLGWELEYAQVIAEEYKRFLTLCLENRDQAIVPPKDVDDFWHYHILDTQKYAQDCQEIFGYFLHHFHYFGMRGDQDAQNLQDSWNDTCQKYLARFGMPSALVQEKVWRATSRCPNCGRGNEGVFMQTRPTLKAV